MIEGVIIVHVRAVQHVVGAHVLNANREPDRELTISASYVEIKSNSKRSDHDNRGLRLLVVGRNSGNSNTQSSAAPLKTQKNEHINNVAA